MGESKGTPTRGVGCRKRTPAWPAWAGKGERSAAYSGGHA